MEADQKGSGYPRQYKPQNHADWPTEMRSSRPVYTGPAHRYCQQTTTIITTVGEFPLEADLLSTSTTEQQQVLNQQVPSAQTAESKESVDHVEKASGNTTHISASDQTSAEEIRINSQPRRMKRKIQPTPHFLTGDFISLDVNESPRKKVADKRGNKMKNEATDSRAKSHGKDSLKIFPTFSPGLQTSKNTVNGLEKLLGTGNVASPITRANDASINNKEEQSNELLPPLKFPFVDLSLSKHTKSNKKRILETYHTPSYTKTTLASADANDFNPNGVKATLGQWTTPSHTKSCGEKVAPGEPNSLSPTNCKKRKVSTLFIPPGDFISLNIKEMPHKKARTVPQQQCLDREEAASVEMCCHNPPYTLTESRRLFMKDKGSSAIYDFFLQSQQSMAVLTKKRHLTEALEKVIRDTLVPNCRMFLVGSSVNGFGSLTSDIDLCLVIDAEQERLMSRKKVLDMLRSLQKLLQQAAFAKDLQVIPAKVPILKFRDALSGLHCDINVNNLTGIRNSELLRCYSSLDHRVQPLVLVVKEWAHQNNINDASCGTLSSYSLVLMVIHFLQCGVEPRLLPALQQSYPRLLTAGTPLAISSEDRRRINTYRSKNNMSLFDLLVKFFEYFGKRFDFGTQVMCVRLGMKRHVKNFQGIGREWQKAIKIEEPFEHSNTARAVSCEVTARRILQKFRNAYESLRTRRRLDCLIKLRKGRNSIVILDD